MLDTRSPCRLLVPAPRSRQGGGPCWWSCRSWSSGTKPSWRWSKTAGRSPRSPSASGSPDRAFTPGSPATSKVAFPRWPIDPTGRRAAPTRPTQRRRPPSANFAGSTRGGGHAGSAISWAGPDSSRFPPARPSTGACAATGRSSCAGEGSVATSSAGGSGSVPCSCGRWTSWAGWSWMTEPSSRSSPGSTTTAGSAWPRAWSPGPPQRPCARS